ncbi:DUF885 domain-containing protein [Limibacter armeniacum]|uniref:DUF885 domain-containing protein n=1 Tax=Limibacter armeniacum TaxID=466084 RepID=UPI002FE60BF6
MKKTLLIGTTAAVLFGCSPQDVKNEGQQTVQSVQNAESAKANAFFERVYEASVDRSPMQQTYLGIKKDYGKWDDISEKAELAELDIAKQDLAFLMDSIDASKLDKQTKLSYELMKMKLEEEIAGYEYRHISYPVNQMHGMQAEVPAFLIGFHAVTSKSDAEAYIERLNGMDTLVSQLIDQLKVREDKGILLPKFLYVKVLQDARNVLKGGPFEDGAEESSVILSDFQTKVEKIEGISEEEKKQLLAAASEALEKHVQPAYESLITVLEAQEKKATDDAGVWRFENGDKFYAYALKKTTTTDLTAEDIHKIGLEEVARIHGEMKEIMKKVGFEGSLKEFFKFMKEDDQFYYPNTEEGKQAYLDSATSLVNEVKGRLDELFLTKPKADMVVKRVEAFREKTAGKAFYNQPAMDGSRPGYYYANLYDMKQMPKYEMEALAFHEGIPGHHMQIAIAQELEGIPEFRKHMFFTAYVEGWGLYSELVPKEIGFYKDPYADFGRLAMELWRACRLVVDTGIHSKKWTREEGIKYYMDNTPAAYGACEKMVDRHIVMPSQATAYKVGMLKILELRKQAKEQLGDAFDIREFHDVVLTNGALPLNILEQLVNEWVASKKA